MKIIEFSKIEQPPQTVKYIGSNEEFTFKDVEEKPSEITITPKQPEQEESPTTTSTDTPPPSTPSGGSGGGGY